MGLEWYDILLLVALGIVSVLMILLVVVQPSKEDGARAFSGEKSELFANKKERGIDVWIKYITAGLSVAFFVLAIIASFFVVRFSF